MATSSRANEKYQLEHVRSYESSGGHLEHGLRYPRLNVNIIYTIAKSSASLSAMLGMHEGIIRPNTSSLVGCSDQKI
jgi:hypothetical protein